ncbi:MAG: hypothetical protein ABSG99_07145 [Sedimentisphaerales bacterium]
MWTKAILFLAPMLLLFSQGCVTYPVVGSFDDHNELFRGTAVTWFTGSSRINIEGVNSKIKGKGRSWLTHIPPTLRSEGRKGEALLTFDDGRVVNAEFTRLSRSSGWGSGKDQSGNTFIYTFGMSDEEAEQFIERTRKTIANHPSLPATGEEPSKASEPIEFKYDAETKTGYISVKGKGPEARSWMLRQIEEICASKNIVIQEGETSEPAHFRVLDETFVDGKFTIKFELVR